jgi:hypothetical protein
MFDAVSEGRHDGERIEDEEKDGKSRIEQMPNCEVRQGTKSWVGKKLLPAGGDTRVILLISCESQSFRWDHLASRPAG